MGMQFRCYSGYGVSILFSYSSATVLFAVFCGVVCGVVTLGLSYSARGVHISVHVPSVDLQKAGQAV